jgi:mercuric ion transport protein
MLSTEMTDSITDSASPATTLQDRVVPASGLVAGLAALVGASCCVLPLTLAILGVGGAWIAYLGPLVAYRSWMLAFAVAIILFAWSAALVRRPGPRAIVLLSLATAAVGAALAVAAYETEITRYLAQVWRSQ